jgi:hypothetical protein
MQGIYEEETNLKWDYGEVQARKQKTDLGEGTITYESVPLTHPT